MCLVWPSLVPWLERKRPRKLLISRAPFNRRGDGYQSSAGSYCGSAAAAATYDWLDFAIETETTGIGRRPALVNGFFQMRPTYDAAYLDGIVPLFKPWDAPALFKRDVRRLKPIISTWYNCRDSVARMVPRHTSPLSLSTPFDYFPVNNKFKCNWSMRFWLILRNLSTLSYAKSLLRLCGTRPGPTRLVIAFKIIFKIPTSIRTSMTDTI